MKPCARQRHSVALLASSSLDAAEAAAVRCHLEDCPACRAYFQELSAVCDSHAAAARVIASSDSEPMACARPVAGSVRQSSRSSHERLWGLRWRWAVGAIATVMLIAYGVGFWRGSQVQLHSPANVVVQPPPTSPGATGIPESAPLLMRYRLALSRSFEDFDGLLARDGMRSGNPRPDSPRPSLGSLQREL
jgi:predicted anti-sigma-YlaC factor YlaD